MVLTRALASHENALSSVTPPRSVLAYEALRLSPRCCWGTASQEARDTSQTAIAKDCCLTMVMMNALRLATRVAPRALSRVSAPTLPRISSSECFLSLREGKLDLSWWCRWGGQNATWLTVVMGAVGSAFHPNHEDLRSWAKESSRQYSVNYSSC